MLNILNKSNWQKVRKESMNAARKTRAVLTNPEGYWRYAPDDQRVKDAVAAWVERARNAHNIVLGRRPVIEKAVIINQGESRQGSLYAA